MKVGDLIRRKDPNLPPRYRRKFLVVRKRRVTLVGTICCGSILTFILIVPLTILMMTTITMLNCLRWLVKVGDIVRFKKDVLGLENQRGIVVADNGGAVDVYWYKGPKMVITDLKGFLVLKGLLVVVNESR